MARQPVIDFSPLSVNCAPPPDPLSNFFSANPMPNFRDQNESPARRRCQSHFPRSAPFQKLTSPAPPSESLQDGETELRLHTPQPSNPLIPPQKELSMPHTQETATSIPDPRRSKPLARPLRSQNKPALAKPQPDLRPGPEAVPTPPAVQGAPGVNRSPDRCSERGCVFPAEENGSGFCFYHERQRLEPALFGSWQPTWLILNRPAAGLYGCASRYDRGHDRRRLAAQWAAFHHELA
jgi:hypothetical protein